MTINDEVEAELLNVDFDTAFAAHEWQAFNNHALVEIHDRSKFPDCLVFLDKHNRFSGFERAFVRERDERIVYLPRPKLTYTNRKFVSVVSRVMIKLDKGVTTNNDPPR